MDKMETLRSAIRKERWISLRTEDQSLEDHKHLFVDSPHNQILSAMSGPANQVVYGRRGTGKTMLLRKLLSDGQPYNPNSEYIAISLQVEDFKRSPDVIESDPMAVRARSYFRSFLQQVAERMYVLGDKVLENEGWLVKLGLRNHERKDRLVDRLLRLNHILQYGVSRLNPGAASRVDSTDSERDVSSSHSKFSGLDFATGVKLGSGSDAPLPAMKISMIGKYSNDEAESSSVNHKSMTRAQIESSFDLGVPEIRQLIREIVEILQVKFLMILIDEWQSLLDCQSEFAQHLKSCFFGLESVAVKIAAYRNVCKFNNGGTRGNFRGIELGQDVSEVGDVDLPPTEKSTQKFLFDILYGRLHYKQKELNAFYGPPEDYNVKEFIKDVFKSAHTAEILVRGAHGISRDFIEAFRISSSKILTEPRFRKIAIDKVNLAHGLLSQKIQENINKADDIGGPLFELVKPHVYSTKAPFFFVSRLKTKWDEFFWELVEKRALHVIEDHRLPAGADVDWKAYEVAYGLFEEWRRAMSFMLDGAETNLNWKEIGELKSDEFDSYVLNLEGHPEAVRTCAFCKCQFSTSAHAFMKKGLCPNCYEPSPSIEQ